MALIGRSCVGLVGHGARLSALRREAEHEAAVHERGAVNLPAFPGQANAALDKFAARAKEIAKITPDRVIREGDTAEEIIKLIDEDADIGILVLAAGTGKEGPGPLVSNLAKTAGTFPIPVALVPGHLSDEEIDASS